MRAAVIGAGIVGSCVGWNLARRGADVLLVDTGPPGAGTTNWTFAWLNASNKTRTREYFDLSAVGLTAHRHLAATLGSAAWLHSTGHLRWTDEPAGAQALRAAIDLMAAWGYDAALWRAETVRRILEPGVRFPGDETEVAFYRDEGWADGRELAVRLMSESLSHGAETHLGRPVTEIAVHGDRVAEIVLAGGHRHQVDAVVNAAGPAGAEIDDLITPGGDTSELSGQLHRLAADVVPALRGAELLEAQVARRPIPADGFPSVGAVSDVAGYYEAVTHSGITLGPVIGALLATEILDGTVDALIAPFRPDRFALERP